MPFPYLLLHPNIPKPLHGLAPRTILGAKWWNKTKAQAKVKFDFHCWACGVHQQEAKSKQWLESHECYSINYNTGRSEYSGTVALCHFCHNFIHDGRLLILYQKNQISEGYYLRILAHGNNILRNWLGKDTSIIKHPFEPNEPFCEHEDWHKVPQKFNNLTWVINPRLPLADWNDYHLILEGIRYERKHQTFQDWLNFYEQS